MRYPVDNPYKITTTFSAAHPGIDIAPVPAGSKGRNCYAPERSKVIASAYKPNLEGNYVMLQGLDTGKYYYFGHFSERKVSLNQNIKEGWVIGTLGMTGLADGIHTHCEVRTTPNGGQINPTPFFASHINNPPEEENMKLSREQWSSLFVELLNRKPSKEDLDHFVTLDAWEGIAGLNNSPERQNIKRLLDLGIQANKDGWKPGDTVGEADKKLKQIKEILS